MPASLPFDIVAQPMDQVCSNALLIAGYQQISGLFHTLCMWTLLRVWTVLLISFISAAKEYYPCIFMGNHCLFTVAHILGVGGGRSFQCCCGYKMHFLVITLWAWRREMWKREKWHNSKSRKGG